MPQAMAEDENLTTGHREFKSALSIFHSLHYNKLSTDYNKLIPFLNKLGERPWNILSDLSQPLKILSTTSTEHMYK